MRQEHMYQTIALDATRARGSRSRRVWPAAARSAVSTLLIGAILLATLLLVPVALWLRASAPETLPEGWIWLIGGGATPVAIYFLFQGVIQSER